MQIPVEQVLRYHSNVLHVDVYQSRSDSSGEHPVREKLVSLRAGLRTPVDNGLGKLVIVSWAVFMSCCFRKNDALIIIVFG